MFELKHIKKVFGDTPALSDISLSITGGMNYIIGASGSGKTTLLHILAALDTQYEGEAFYDGKSLKTLQDSEKARFHAAELGFIAQGLHLMDELSVRENILLPAYLKNGSSEKQLEQLLQTLDLAKIEHQTVSTLSGGQRQRVAIARELMKKPKVLLADEPTAALDPTTAHEIAALFCEIAKERTVVIVTHDSSLIHGPCSVFELDQGVLCSSILSEQPVKATGDPAPQIGLSLSSALCMARVNFKRQAGKLLSVAAAVTLAASSLGVSCSGMIGENSSQTFQQLLAEQGDSVLNLDVVSSFVGADSKETSSGGQCVEQDLAGLMERYQDDSRVAGITMLSSIKDAVIHLGDQDFIIEESGQAPVFNHMLVGSTADNTKHEIVLPEILVEKMGQRSEEIIGKEISMIGSIFNWDSGEPVAMPISFTATVSGVADTSYVIDYPDGSCERYAAEDSLFLSLAVLQDMYAQAGIQHPGFNFTIRPTSPETYLEIYEELMSQGIVPLGRVELMRDIVGLKGDAMAQTGISYGILAALSALAGLTVCLVCSYMRRKEYAIYKLCGYRKADILLLILAESAVGCVCSAVLCMVSACVLAVPVWLSGTLCLGISAICCLLNGLIAISTNPLTALKTGGR